MIDFGRGFRDELEKHAGTLRRAIIAARPQWEQFVAGMQDPFTAKDVFGVAEPLVKRIRPKAKKRDLAATEAVATDDQAPQGGP